MTDDKVEGNEKKCGKCQTELICVKIIDTYQNRNTEKLQWQNKSTGTPHFKFAGPGKFNCMMPNEDTKPAEAPTQTEAPKPKKEIDITVKVTNPFEEAEIITRWAGERAYKIVMAEVTDINNLSPQEKSGLGQKEGMLTRALINTVMELRKLNNVKSEYGQK